MRAGRVQRLISYSPAEDILMLSRCGSRYQRLERAEHKACALPLHLNRDNTAAGQASRHAALSGPAPCPSFSVMASHGSRKLFECYYRIIRLTKVAVITV